VALVVVMAVPMLMPVVMIVAVLMIALVVGQGVALRPASRCGSQPITRGPGTLWTGALLIRNPAPMEPIP
jgi:hypothetical protein